METAVQILYLSNEWIVKTAIPFLKDSVIQDLFTSVMDEKMKSLEPLFNLFFDAIPSPCLHMVYHQLKKPWHGEYFLEYSPQGVDRYPVFARNASQINIHLHQGDMDLVIQEMHALYDVIYEETTQFLSSVSHWKKKTNEKVAAIPSCIES